MGFNRFLQFNEYYDDCLFFIFRMFFGKDDIVEEDIV